MNYYSKDAPPKMVAPNTPGASPAVEERNGEKMALLGSSSYNPMPKVKDVPQQAIVRFQAPFVLA